MHWDDPATQIMEIHSEQRGLVLVLGVDDKHDEVLKRALAHANLRCLQATDAKACLQLIQSEKPDLVIYHSASLASGETSFRADVEKARATQTLPVLRLGVPQHDKSGCIGLSASSSVAEVFLTVRALLRRERPSALSCQRTVGDFILDEPGFKLRHADRCVPLNMTDLCLLGPFFDLKNAVFDRETLVNLAFDETGWKDGSRTIDAHVNRVRRKIKAGIGRDPIRSVRGVGYAFDCA